MVTVTTEPAGNTFEVDADSTILSSAMEAGVNLPYGCGNGFCGSCKAKLVSGKIVYEEGYSPDILTDDDQDMILCCKALCKTDVTLDVHEVVMADIKAEIFNVKVLEIEQVADDVIIMQLLMGEDNHMQFLAGQYLEFILKDGKRRAFSIGNAPKANGKIELHLRQITEGTFTNNLFAGGMNIGDILQIEGPLGTFFLREESERDIVMIAGGTGLAPIKGMLEHAIDEGLKKQIYVYWGACDVKDLYLHETMQSLVAKHKNIDYVPVLSDTTEKSNWDGATGYVTDVVAKNHPDIAKFEVYMAGPPVMVNAGKDAFIKLGLPEERMFSDSFEIADETENK